MTEQPSHGFREQVKKIPEMFYLSKSTCNQDFREDDFRIQ